MIDTPEISPAGVAAVVLAAGFSSRMGRLKPLLPLGSGTALERVVPSLRAAGVSRVVVVTGHEARTVAPVVERLGAEQAHNAGYESGMFSSVRAGVAALPAETEAFFVLPVDCPLVTPRSLRLLVERFGKGGSGAVYPTCFGRRGHPPLLAGRYIAPLLAADPGGNLQAFLAAQGGDEVEVDVRDLTVLMDMDTPDDYRALSHLAEVLDAAGAGLPEPSLAAADALFLLAAAKTPPNVVRHCRTAAAVGEALAEALKPAIPALDVDLVRAGCLLHDIARLEPHHAFLAAEVLTNLGLPHLGEIVGEHMVIDPALPRAPGISEAELVFLADKTVAEEEIVGLDERQARTMRKMRPGPKTARQIAARIGEGRMIAEKIAAVVGHPVEDVLRAVKIPTEAQADTMRVYLVRHAQPDGPEDRRYHGQEDRPLGAEGRKQAGELAGKLMSLTGGACFDAIFASDLARSRQTAEIVAGECSTPVRTEAWLREIDVGWWEGLTWEEARERFPAEHAAREGDILATPFPGGESFEDLRRRVIAGYERLLEASRTAGHRRVLVVAHKGVNRVLLAALKGAPADLFTIQQDFCAVTELEIPCYCTAPAISKESTSM